MMCFLFEHESHESHEFRELLRSRCRPDGTYELSRCMNIRGIREISGL